MCTENKTNKKSNQRIWTFTTRIIKNLNEIEDFFYITFEINDHKVIITNLTEDLISFKKSDLFFEEINYTSITSLKIFFQKINYNVLIRINYSKISIDRKVITAEDQEKILDEFENNEHDIKSKKVTEVFKYFLKFLNDNEENISANNSQLCVTFFFDILLFGDINCNLINLDQTLEIVYPKFVNKNNFINNNNNNNNNNKKNNHKFMTVHYFTEKEINIKGKKLSILLNCKERQILHAETYKNPNKLNKILIRTKTDYN